MPDGYLVDLTLKGTIMGITNPGGAGGGGLPFTFLVLNITRYPLDGQNGEYTVLYNDTGLTLGDLVWDDTGVFHLSYTGSYLGVSVRYGGCYETVDWYTIAANQAENTGVFQFTTMNNGATSDFETQGTGEGWIEVDIYAVGT